MEHAGQNEEGQARIPEMNQQQAMNMVVHAMFQPQEFDPEYLEKVTEVIKNAPLIQTMLADVDMAARTQVSEEVKEILDDRAETIDDLGNQLSAAQRELIRLRHGNLTGSPAVEEEEVPLDASPATPPPSPVQAPVDNRNVSEIVQGLVAALGITPPNAPVPPSTPIPAHPAGRTTSSGYRPAASPSSVDRRNPILPWIKTS